MQSPARKRSKIGAPPPTTITTSVVLSAALSRPHPYAVQPYGNALTSEGQLSGHAGLGTLAALSDDAILKILELLSPSTLATFAQASRACYVFAHHSDLWRTHVLRIARERNSSFAYSTSWRDTCVELMTLTQFPHTPLAVPPLYSDALFQPWAYASMEIDAKWLQRETIPRVSALSVDDFIAQFETPNQPVIFTDVASAWPALRLWTDDYLRMHSPPATLFAAGPAQMSMSDYLQYMYQTTDERPLYIFDRSFVDKAPQLGKDYTVPPYFSNENDMFSRLGAKRPHYRWLIIGPKKSGSSWHMDPNGTSAWNALVRGCKRWIMCPPQYTPPGVLLSPDGTAVTSPISLMEWFVNFYDALTKSDIPFVEATLHTGEMIFVPRGWWHVVLNLEDSIAVTQNYAPPSQLPHTLHFLRDKSDQVSGVPRGFKLYDELCATLAQTDAAVLDRAQAELNRIANSKRSLWSRITEQSHSNSHCANGTTTASTNNESGFSFGFG